MTNVYGRHLETLVANLRALKKRRTIKQNDEAVCLDGVHAHLYLSVLSVSDDRGTARVTILGTTSEFEIELAHIIHFDDYIDVSLAMDAATNEAVGEVLQ